MYVECKTCTLDVKTHQGIKSTTSLYTAPPKQQQQQQQLLIAACLQTFTSSDKLETMHLEAKNPVSRAGFTESSVPHAPTPQQPGKDFGFDPPSTPCVCPWYPVSFPPFFSQRRLILAHPAHKLSRDQLKNVQFTKLINPKQKKRTILKADKPQAKKHTGDKAFLHHGPHILLNSLFHVSVFLSLKLNGLASPSKALLDASPRGVPLGKVCSEHKPLLVLSVSQQSCSPARRDITSAVHQHWS